MTKNSKSTAETRPPSPARARPPRPSSRPRPSAAIPAGSKSETPALEKTGPKPGRRPREITGTNFTFSANPTLTLVCLPTGAPALFSLDDAARLTGVHPAMLRYYSQAGLIETLQGVRKTELFFDETALGEIRRIEHYRSFLGAGRRALPLICELRREGERQQIELGFLLGP